MGNPPRESYIHFLAGFFLGFITSVADFAKNSMMKPRKNPPKNERGKKLRI
jgi:hypothetical protein